MADPQEPQNAVDEVEIKEARQYWGQLFQPDKQCTERLQELLLAIAKYIVSSTDSRGFRCV
jgi:hypothetical protein